MRIALQPDPYSSYPNPVYSDNTSVWHHMSSALQASVERVLSLLVVILPGVLAFFLVLLLLTLLGMLLSYILRRALAAAKFDERMTRRDTSSIADWSPAHSPTALVGRVAFWGCVLLGLIIGVSAFDTSVQTGSSTLTLSLLPYLTHSVGAILLLFVGNLIARFLARTVLIGAVNNQLQYARFLSMGVKWLVLVLTAAMVLDHLQIGGAIVELAFGILFGGIVLTLALAVGLGSRDLVTRSLERSAERSDRPERPPLSDAPTPSETLRHF
jgi:hypothetical protein